MLVLPPNAEGIAEAARRIRVGGVVAYPTETVYGLGVDPRNEEALAALFRAKGRPDTNPVLVIVGSECQLEGIVDDLSPAARECIQHFWPGPLSLLLPAAPGLPDSIAPSGGKVCVRCPGHEVARRLCDAAGFAITSTSANQSGEPPATTASMCMELRIDAVLDGGTLDSQIPSTVYDPDERRVLREGAVATSALLGF